MSFVLFLLHNIYIYIYMVVIMYCMFSQLGKYQVKNMNVYIEPLIDKRL